MIEKSPGNSLGFVPVNHPQRRVACLATIVHHWEKFRAACLDFAGSQDFFQELRHPYWSHHYTVKSKRSMRNLALMGADRLTDFQINHLMPAYLVDGDRGAWEYYEKLQAPAISEKVDKASNSLVWRY